MSDDEVREGLGAHRDGIQKILEDARSMRAKLSLDNIDKHRDFTQKIGDLSFLIGATIVPIIIVSSRAKVYSPGFVLAGVGLYLLTGFLSLWHSKSIFEKNAEDTPFIGLDEEIHAYPRNICPQ